MILRCREHHNHWDECTHHEPSVDLYVREHDEPPITMALFEFTRTLGACDAACRIFAPIQSYSALTLCSVGEVDRPYANA